MRAASASTSSARRPTTAGRPRSGAWTAESAPRGTTSRRRAPCSRRSSSRSGGEGAKAHLKRENPRDRHGEKELDRKEQPAGQAPQEVLGPPVPPQGAHPGQGPADGGS